MNGTVCDKKSPPSYDEKSTKCLNRNGRNTGKEKKSKTKVKDIPSRGPSASPSFQRSLTPSLDPKLLRQFEEEDRPKRVLRSSTAAASLPKITIANGTIINDGPTKVISPGFTVKMAAKKSASRKSILKKPKQRKSEKPSTNFTDDNTLPVGSVTYSTQLNEGVKRKRSQSKETELHSKRLKVCFRLHVRMI